MASVTPRRAATAAVMVLVVGYGAAGAPAPSLDVGGGGSMAVETATPTPTATATVETTTAPAETATPTGTPTAALTTDGGGGSVNVESTETPTTTPTPTPEPTPEPFDAAAVSVASTNVAIGADYEPADSWGDEADDVVAWELSVTFENPNTQAATVDFEVYGHPDYDGLTVYGPNESVDAGGLGDRPEPVTVPAGGTYTHTYIVASTTLGEPGWNPAEVGFVVDLQAVTEA